MANGLGVLLRFIGTSVFGELQDSLDRIWRVPTRSQASGWLKLVRSRLLSFGTIPATGFLLIDSLVLSATLATAGRWLQPLCGGWYALVQGTTSVGVFLLVAAMFALIYKVMPRVHVQWRDVWIGALFTATFYPGQVPARAVGRPQRRGLRLWCSGLAGGDLAVGVLLGPDLSGRGGIHLGLRERVWFQKNRPEATAHRRLSRAQVARRDTRTQARALARPSSC
jgi:hypothetical protein